MERHHGFRAQESRASHWHLVSRRRRLRRPWAYALISRRDNPYSRFQKITEASQDGWDNVKDAMEKGLGGLKQALHTVQSSFEIDMLFKKEILLC